MTQTCHTDPVLSTHPDLFSSLINIVYYKCIFTVFIIHISQTKDAAEVEKRTENGLVLGHAYGVTAMKKVLSTDIQK